MRCLCHILGVTDFIHDGPGNVFFNKDTLHKITYTPLYLMLYEKVSLDNMVTFKVSLVNRVMTHNLGR